MKRPLTPKPLSELLTKHSKSLSDVLGRQQFVPTVGGHYEHWDRLFRQEPPAGLDHEQWWLGIKLSRSSQYRKLPLHDTRRRPFVYMLPDQVQQALHRIDSQARGWVGTPEHLTNRNCSPGGSTGYSLSWLRQSTAFPCRAMVVATSGL